mgnify:CR=1 FL=1
MKLESVTSEQIREARKAKFRRKKPKKPKLSASKSVYKNFVNRYNDWAKAVKKAAADYREKEKLKEKIRNL